MCSPGRGDGGSRRRAAIGADGLAASRPPLIGDALVRLAELRRRQGRLDEADELFGRCEGNPLALLGRAAVALDRDRPSEAAELADRYLRGFPDRNRTERCAGLEIAVRAYCAQGEHRAGQGSARPTGGDRRPGWDAAAAGGGTHRRGDGRGGRRAITMPPGAVSRTRSICWPSGAPFETARARLDLGAVLGALGRHEPARREFETARAVLRAPRCHGATAQAEALLAGSASAEARRPASSSEVRWPSSARASARCSAWSPRA